MSGAWNQSTREEVTGWSWQKSWHPVFSGLGLPICCCVPSFWCGRFSMLSSATQKYVVHINTLATMPFFIQCSSQYFHLCLPRWSSGSPVLWGRDAGLFMVAATCVTSMSWTTSSCHASAKATRWLFLHTDDPPELSFGYQLNFIMLPLNCGVEHYESLIQLCIDIMILMLGPMLLINSW